jgi:hypothetical protein
MADPPTSSLPEPGSRAVVREFVAIAGLLAALFFGGMAIGLAIALAFGGGTVGAIFVGFVTLPLAFGLSMAAWRAWLGAWLLGHLAKSALRSGGDEARFRDEMKRSLGTIREGGPATRPGTWVFVPTTLVVGLVGAVLMAITAQGDGLTAGTLTLAACVGLGVLLRRLARTGRLPIPEE